MKKILFLSLIFAHFFVFSQNESLHLEQTFTKNNYTIQYPQSWKLDTSKLMGTEFFVFSPLENETDKFKENVNIIIQNLEGQDINLQKYKEISEKQFNTMVTDVKIYKSIITNKHNKGCFMANYAMTQGKYRLMITSICYIVNDKAYLVTFSSEFDKYDKYKTVGEEILNSFDLTK